jgi:signal transduction histidine kinase
MDSPAPDLRIRIALLAAAGVVACAVAVAVALAGSDSPTPGLVAAVRAVTVGLPIGVGLYAWYRRPRIRFGPLLVAAGFAWFLTTFAESSDSVLYSIGRLSGWVVEVGLVYLVLAFPTGRLASRLDRVLVAAGAAMLVTLWLPSVFFGDEFPLPSYTTSCTSDCPSNAFFLLDEEPAFVDSVVRPLREVLLAVLFAAVALRLWQRVRHASPLMRRTLAPVLVVAIGRLVLIILFAITRGADPDSVASKTDVWLIALAVPAIALGFLAGLLWWRLFVAEALHRLAIRLRASSGPDELRDALAEAFHDPGVQIAYPGTGEWVDADGRPVHLPSPGSGRSVTEVHDGGHVIAAIVHDEALSDQPELIDAAAGYAAMTLENYALAARVSASLIELSESRARVVASADEERRRIERDLHDGAQQRLVALRIKLELTEELVKQHPERGIERLHALGMEVTEALDEIRSLARGVYPSRLAERGLCEALRAAALSAPIYTTVTPDGVGRHASEIESAVYFSVLEALQNASKHAEGATLVAISLSESEVLRFEVRDDGAGFDPHAGSEGAGIANIRDRIAAVGGSVEISSAASGTVVAGAIPLRQLRPGSPRGTPARP